MARRRGLLWLASMCLAAAAGCPGYTSGIRRGADADTRFAYLYGRFYMNAPTNPAYAFGHAQSMGFLIRCQDGSEYVFGSRPKRDIQVLKIRPSRCWLIEAQMADQGGQILKRLPTEPPVQRPLDFVAGRAYYDDRYDSTTAEMRNVYPHFASLPVADMRLIPRPSASVATASSPPLASRRCHPSASPSWRRSSNATTDRPPNARPPVQPVSAFLIAPTAGRRWPA